MKRFSIVFLLPALAFSATYEFDTVLKKALENNNEYRAKKLNVDIAKARLKEIASKKFGEVNLNENYSRTNHAGYVFMDKLASREATFADFGFADFLRAQSNSQNPLPIVPNDLNNPQARDNYETTAEYRLPIFTGFAMYNEEKAAKNMEMAANIIASQDKKKLELEVLRAYNFAVASKKYLEATKLSVKSVDLIVRNTNEMYKEKLASKTDVMEATHAKAAVSAKESEAEANFETAIYYLKFLINDEDVSDVGGFYDVGAANGNAENRDDVRITSYVKEAAKHKSDALYSEYLPKVFAFAKYGYNDNTLTLSSSKDFYMVGVGVSYNLTDFGGGSARREAARAEYLKASLEAASMKSYAKFDAKQKELAVKQKEFALTQAVTQKELSSQIFENYKLKYQNGLTNIAELIKKEADASIAVAREIEAKAMFLGAKAEYRYSIGLGLKD